MANKLLETFKGKSFETPPAWLMRQAGRYLPEYRELRTRAKTFLDFCYTPELAIEATLQPVRRFGFDAAILFSDILVVPHALGIPVSFKEGEGPVLETVGSEAEIESLVQSTRVEVLEPVYQAMAGVRERLPAEKALFGFAGAPWTVAVYMLEGRSGSDCSVARSFAAAYPERLDRLLEIIGTATVEHLDRQIRAGADILQLFDSWAGVLDATGFDRFVIEPTRRIVDDLRERHPDIPIVGFPRGAGTNLEAYAGRSGVGGLQLDSSVAPEWAVSTVPDGIVLQGNLDNIVLRAGGAGMRKRVKELLAAMRERPFIFNLGHGILPDTPLENVETLLTLIREERE